MSEHLTKAKAALDHASDLDVAIDDEHPPIGYLRLMSIADVQANVAAAEATERIADALEEILASLTLNERRAIAAMKPIPICSDLTTTPRGVNAVHDGLTEGAKGDR